MDKVIPKLEEAIHDIEDGALIAIGGFFTCGVPRDLLKAIISKGIKDLTFACGSGPLLGAKEEMSELVANNQIKKVIDSYGLARSTSKGLDDPFEAQVRANKIELEVVPMGTLAEKYRAAGAGIPAFYVKTGAGTFVEDGLVTNFSENTNGKETKIIDGEKYVLEYSIKPDFALVHAYMGDKEGNLYYRKTARNFNHVMATAGKVTIAEVEKIVEPGEIDSHCIHTPGIYVQRVVQVSRREFEITID
ncbi:MAG: CoA transferase subunit A [Deltaproteobacteria bacterium]|nr:CoA transferase subunit A [Deltaproteobacteria bacterium]MBW2052794.1 CoA transferase subunit A [Deltaproteobacteria bacterium]MBW2142033.1 CoA transferase subunit A [Deltaproteobacteria bacterium]MBW2324683.1 CoA transferase subunit A [Deltaproteobacteria bacterium]